MIHHATPSGCTISIVLEYVLVAFISGSILELLMFDGRNDIYDMIHDIHGSQERRDWQRG